MRTGGDAKLIANPQRARGSSSYRPEVDLVLLHVVGINIVAVFAHAINFAAEVRQSAGHVFS
jgi:hypothetical protein